MITKKPNEPKMRKIESGIKRILADLFCRVKVVFNPDDFEEVESNKLLTYKRINQAFLAILSLNNDDPGYKNAEAYFKRVGQIKEFKSIVEFYLKGKALIFSEIKKKIRGDEEFLAVFNRLSNIKQKSDNSRITEELWELFFPEGVGIQGREFAEVSRLREKRRVLITKKNSKPIRDPAGEILFSSNIMLTTPFSEIGDKSKDSNDGEIYAAAQAAGNEKQLYWYDHPIPFGVKLQNNEILYGLKNLDKAVEFEKSRGKIPGGKLTCILSVSVTHQGLQKLAKEYISSMLKKIEPLKNLEIYAFTEEDCKEIIGKILNPAAEKYLSSKLIKSGLKIFGVDGRYGRHYSFLKAIAAFWSVLIDPQKRATFKIDLDQIFPQEEIVKYTGLSAFEHFQTPLWGAEGVSQSGSKLELGMIAGSLVNFSDIKQNLFTADVKFPGGDKTPEDYVFYSCLPQALSTKAEMLAKYDSRELDGENYCIQRIHVTGGTNGILIDYLFKYRPFTPGFIGRAEDQAYLLSAMRDKNKRLGYLHKPGLIMRHDKNVFAQEAIRSAGAGKLIGDYLRILYFSSYAEILPGGLSDTKKELGPFTGCFISRIPLTIVHLRFALKMVDLFRKEESGVIEELMESGIPRIVSAIKDTFSQQSIIKETFLREREDWDLFYDILEAIKGAKVKETDFYSRISVSAVSIINKCRIN
jgi:hypothetical protein